MFAKIVNKLRDCGNSKNKSDIMLMNEFADSCTSNLSCEEPKLNADVYKDDIFKSFIATLKAKRSEYYEMHLSEATKRFEFFTNLLLKIEKTDPQGAKLGQLLKNNGILDMVKKYIDPKIAFEQFITLYKFKMSDIGGDDRTKTLETFKRTFILMRKCISAIYDISGKIIISLEKDLAEMDLTEDTRNKCVTEKDFADTYLTDHFEKIYGFYQIFKLINPEFKKAVCVELREIYAHMVYAIFTGNKYIVSFPDAYPQVFYFGLFMNNIKPFSELLKPIGFNNMEPAVIMIDKLVQ